MPEIDQRLRGGQREEGSYVVHSLSGNERNHLFVNQAGTSFTDLSALSGMDTPADSRGFAVLDYDHDGWQDIAIVNANAPLFNLYHNQMGEIAAASERSAIAIRFIGGSRAAGITNKGEFSCRDGYGAIVTADLGDTTIEREHRCGEGFGVQNSATMILGIGERKEVPSLTVRWPSGKTSKALNVAAGTLITVHEDPSELPGGDSIVRSIYKDVSISSRAVPLRQTEFPIKDVRPIARFHVYTTMATWCEACRTHLPQLRTLKSEFGSDGIDLVGLPVDDADDSAALQKYTEECQPAYRLVYELDAGSRRLVSDFLEQELGGEPALPSTVITDGSGIVLKVMEGVPTVSHVRKLANAIHRNGTP
ncbi:MAG: ASPIC/UnbV domain-containing protein [Planctomycetales bacterium]|nr:ASPIC/UnbV domain-containing protein [Planctomycetales bacterium]